MKCYRKIIYGATCYGIGAACRSGRDTLILEPGIHPGGEFADTRYTIRYFQPDGKGTLRMDNGTVFKPNDRYPLTKDVFRLYYTSASTDRQTIDVYVEDNFGQIAKLSFNFNNEKAEEKGKTNSAVTKALNDANC